MKVTEKEGMAIGLWEGVDIRVLTLQPTWKLDKSFGSKVVVGISQRAQGQGGDVLCRMGVERQPG